MLQHVLIHLANLIYLASYAVKDIKKLRWLTVAGISLLIPYYIILNIWEPVLWSLVFLGINLYQLKRLTHSRNEKESST